MALTKHVTRKPCKLTCGHICNYVLGGSCTPLLPLHSSAPLSLSFTPPLTTSYLTYPPASLSLHCLTPLCLFLFSSLGEDEEAMESGVHVWPVATALAWRNGLVAMAPAAM